MNGGPAELRLAIDSELEHVCLVGIAVQRVAERMGFDRATSDGVELAVVEAVTNSILHGYSGRSGGSVEVRARVHSDRLEIEVCDRGAPRPAGMFDSARVALPEGTVEGGRGAFLITSLMDEVESRADESGNVLRLTKRLSRGRPS